MRATIETTAESASERRDCSIVLFAVGGVPLALAYKAVSTLDSMIGHRNDGTGTSDGPRSTGRSRQWIPARVDAALTVVAAGFSMHGIKYAVHSASVFWRDGHKHPSPNSGRPEAAMAGALGIQLGGLNRYDGLPSERPRLGDKREPLAVAHIAQAKRTMTIAYVFAVAGVAGLLWK